ncbi:hypothetical protein RST01_02160 [Rummeliibacillus stabekisii]|nr:hypothetical protein RST01_02160 [Rummeliibacillus stabekisii]
MHQLVGLYIFFVITVSNVLSPTNNTYIVQVLSTIIKLLKLIIIRLPKFITFFKFQTYNKDAMTIITILYSFVGYPKLSFPKTKNLREN